MSYFLKKTHVAAPLSLHVEMRFHKACFYGEICKIVQNLSPLPLLIYSTEADINCKLNTSYTGNFDSDISLVNNAVYPLWSTVS